MAERSTFFGEAARRVAIGYGFDPVQFPVEVVTVDDDLLFLQLEDGKTIVIGAQMFADREEHRHHWEQREDDSLGCVDCPARYAG